MFNAEYILRRLESAPLPFSIVHRYGGGADTNRRAFVNLVRPGATVIEIGANKGTYTALFSRLVDSSGVVHAFEPVSESFDCLTERLRSSNVTNVHVWKMALADGNVSEANIIIPGGDSQQASLVAHKAGSWQGGAKTRSETVEMTSLDAFLARQKIPGVEFVKLDVEGAELSVLRGGRECFTRWKPVLHLEMNSDWLSDFGVTVGDVTQSLRSYGYTFVYKMDARSLKGFSHANESDYAPAGGAPVSGDFVFSASAL